MLEKHIKLRNLWNNFLNVVFPARCMSCGKEGCDLCTDCLCASPSAERESAEWIFPAFDYRHIPVKKAIWLLKYKNRRNLAKIFALVIYGKIIEELSDLSVLQNFREPILIPVPLSAKRYRERGYNQAELICNELVKLDQERKEDRRWTSFETSNVYLEIGKNILIKIKETEHQANIKDRRERLKNLSGTFAVKNRELLEKKNVILIDDVTTTGATLNEARKILKENGARKVIAFTIAH